MSEQTLRKNVVEILAPLDAKPVENPAWPGFPDVSYVEGLIELKQVMRWPHRLTTPLKLDHFTRQQRIFLHRRWRKGGNCYLLLEVQSEKVFLLFDGSDPWKIGVSLSEVELREKAIKIFEGLNQLRKGLAEWLHRRQTSQHQ